MKYVYLMTKNKGEIAAAQSIFDKYKTGHFELAAAFADKNGSIHEFSYSVPIEFEEEFPPIVGINL